MQGLGPIRHFLVTDHERLDALLISAVKPSGEVDFPTYAEFRAGLLRHIGIEEKLVFPASQRANGGIPLPITARLRLEHGALALLLVPTPSADTVESIRSVLAAHNAVEEGPGGIYDVCERLPGGEMEVLLGHMKSYPPVKVAPHFDGPEICRRVEDALRAVSRGHTETAESVASRQECTTRPLRSKVPRNEGDPFERDDSVHETRGRRGRHHGVLLQPPVGVRIPGWTGDRPHFDRPADDGRRG